MVVQPIIMSLAGIDPTQTFVATALVSGLGCISMGLFANVPFVLAPGMGINALFVKYAVDIGYGWKATLGVSFLMGVANLILTVKFDFR